MKRTKSSAVEYLKRGFFKGAGIGAGLATSSIFAAAAAMNIFAPGQTISSTQINQNFAMAAPEGAVVAFYLASCPEGWAPADGTNGTPDLRGVFVRGRNDFGSGTRADGYEDPAGLRALGAIQGDAFQGHRHSIITAGNSNMAQGNGGTTYAAGGGFDGFSVAIGDPSNDGTNGAPRNASETRTKNVAMIYCMRKN